MSLRYFVSDRVVLGRTIGRGGGLVWAFPGLIWSVWALSKWCGTAADPLSLVVAPGFVTVRWGVGTGVNMRVNWDRV